MRRGRDEISEVADCLVLILDNNRLVIGDMPRRGKHPDPLGREAQADSGTSWPDGFDPTKHGIEPWPAS